MHNVQYFATFVFPLVVFFGQSFDGVLPTCDKHDWNSWNFSNSPLEIFIARSNNVTLVLHDTLHETIIGIGSFVTARQAFKSWISSDS